MNFKILLVLAAICIVGAYSQTHQLLKIDRYGFLTNQTYPPSIINESSSLGYSCNSDKLIGGTYVQLNTCMVFQGYVSYFEIDGNGNVNATYYNDGKCKKIVNQYTYTTNLCTTDYSFDGSPVQWSIIDYAYMDYTDNSVIVVSYAGSCGDSNWKENLLYSEYSLTNKCLYLTIGSVTINCNSTTITESFSSTYDSCENVNKVTNIPMTDSCGSYGVNFLSICNSN